MTLGQPVSSIREWFREHGIRQHPGFCFYRQATVAGGPQHIAASNLFDLGWQNRINQLFSHHRLLGGTIDHDNRDSSIHRI